MDESAELALVEGLFVESLEIVEERFGGLIIGTRLDEKEGEANEVLGSGVEKVSDLDVGGSGRRSFGFEFGKDFCLEISERLIGSH